MGKFGKNRRKKEGRTPKPAGERKGKGYETIMKENPEFETYYKMQGIVPETEWEAFMEANRANLPATFRVTGSRGQADALIHLIQNTYLQDLAQANASTAEETGPQEKEIQISPLPWYPGSLAYQMNLARADIRKTEAYVKLHNFLMSETDSGNISRQETVSMIPPVVLQVEPHHKVLDMCAAPGSKTAQILEFLHAGESRIPEGVVIANDVENKRCYMLVHQAKRLQSPALVVTNHDGTDYPDIFVKEGDGLVPLKFDRVLCDVPCSGDGTLRKNLPLWKKWNASNAIQLHGTQHRIAKRGLELLEVGGQLVYSTCSLNPIENEAVVHHLLRDCAGAVELIDITNLPGLKSSPGLLSWIPTEKNLESYPDFDSIKDKGKSILREYHYPPSKAEKEKYPLEKCIRILPHQQNTGGFFIALLKKTGPLPWEKPPLPENRIALTIPRNKNGRPEKKIPKMQGYKEDPYILMTEESKVWNSLKEFYSLDKSLDASRFLFRSEGDKPKNIYLTTDLLKNIVQTNTDYLKIINTGVKAFARSENPSSTCDYRLASEGVGSMVSLINSRIAKIPREDLVTILLNTDMHTPPLVANLSPATQAAVQDLSRGCFVLVVDCSFPDGPTFTVEVLGWRGNASIRAYVPLNERVHYLRMCGQDVTQFEKNKYKEVSPAAEVGQEQE